MVELSADEIRLIELVREIKESSAHGEISVIIRNGKIEMVKQTKTIKV
jgi:hypothetical protein